MITITLILIRTGHAAETITTTMTSIPSVHEFVRLGGLLYRVEDVTHDVETQAIEVRAIA